MSDRRPARALTVVHAGVVVVVAAGATTCWLAMMRGALAAMSFEPTTEAVIRAEHFRSQTLGAAGGVVLLIVALALLVHRWAVLPLAGPGLVVGVLTAVLPQTAAFIIGAVLTGVALCATGLMFSLGNRSHRSAGILGATPGGRPLAVVAAAVLAACYALVLTGVAAVIAFEQLLGTGRLGAQHLDGLALRGVVSFVVLLLVSATSLLTGSRRLLRAGERRLVLVPLVIVLAVGTIGELVDVLGTATLRSDAVGLAILLLAAAPVVLVCTPASRAWPPNPPGDNPDRPTVASDLR